MGATMNKLLSICLVCVCLIQDGFSAASVAVNEVNEVNYQENSSPIRPSSSLKLRDVSSKRPREDSASISPSDSRTPPPRTDRPAGTRFEFSDTHKNILRQSGIPELQISRIELLQTALFRSPHGNQFDPRSYLTETELESICNKIGSEEVRLLVFTLKSLYDKKSP